MRRGKGATKRPAGLIDSRCNLGSARLSLFDHATFLSFFRTSTSQLLRNVRESFRSDLATHVFTTVRTGHHPTKPGPIPVLSPHSETPTRHLMWARSPGEKGLRLAHSADLAGVLAQHQRCLHTVFEAVHFLVAKHILEYAC